MTDLDKGFAMGIYGLGVGRAYIAEDGWSDVPVEELFADDGSPKQSYPVYSDVTFKGCEYTCNSFLDPYA